MEDVVGDQEKKEQYNALTSEIISEAKRTAHDNGDVRIEMETIDEGIDKFNGEQVEQTQDDIDHFILEQGQESLFNQEETA